MSSFGNGTSTDYLVPLMNFSWARCIKAYQWSKFILMTSMRAFFYSVAVSSHLLCPLLALYTLNYTKIGGSRQQQRTIHRKMISRGLTLLPCFDARQLLLSYYQIYLWLSFHLTLSPHWYIEYNTSVAHISRIIWDKYEHTSHFGLLWPSDGMFTHCLMTLVIALVWIITLILLIGASLGSCLGSFWTHRTHVSLRGSFNWLQCAIKKFSFWYPQTTHHIIALNLNIDFRIALASIVLSASDVDHNANHYGEHFSRCQHHEEKHHR